MIRVLCGLAAFAVLATPAAIATDPILAAALARLAADAPGTAGISVLHIESGASAAVNGGERFPMMSVYKLPIAIHALREAEAGRLDLAERATLTASDRVAYDWAMARR